MIELKGIAIRSASRAPMVELRQALVTIEQGVAGDYRGKPGARQLSILSLDAWNKACDELGVSLPWTTRRANLLVEGREFGPRDVGKIVQLGTLRMKISIETDPCFRMDEQHPGLKEALMPEWRGGVCCTVLESGEIAIGDPLEIG